MLPCAGGTGAAFGVTTTFGDDPAGGGITPGAVDGEKPGDIICGAIVGATAEDIGPIIGPTAGETIGAPPIGPPPPVGIVPTLWPSALPHARQNFIPGGFSPWHTPQITGNPAGAAVVWA